MDKKQKKLVASEESEKTSHSHEIVENEVDDEVKEFSDQQLENSDYDEFYVSGVD